MKRLVREPFFHFLILGALIYGISQVQISRPEIRIGADQIQRMVATYQKQYGSPPSDRQLKALVDAHLREEIFYREGLALHLDRDDEIVRRRIAQKYEFLQQDLARLKEPTEADLQAFFQQNRTQYASPVRISFTHIYFSPDQGGDAQARSRAEQVLKSLSPEVARAPERGDRFPELYDYAALGPVEATRLFGESNFTQAIFNVPLRQWTRPIRSGYGWHLVRLTAREPARVPPLVEVRDRVLADWTAQQRQRMNAAAFELLKKQYIIKEVPALAARH